MSRSLDQLVEDGLIQKWAGYLGPRRMPNRRLFLSAEFIKWLLQLSEENGSRLLTERAEIEAIFAEFVAGRPLPNVILDVNPPAGEGIKKIKTQRFRLWGWAAAPQTLVLVLGARKQDIADKTVIEREMGKKALSIRQSMGVTEAAKGHWSDLFKSTK